MVTFVTDYQMVSTTDIGIPARGGAVWIDNKRAQGETQFAIFKLGVEDFFTKYPQDHVYVLMDASLPGGPVVPYTGRGVIITKQDNNLIFQFENFRNQQLLPAFAIPYATELDVMVQANRDGLAVWAGGKYQWALMPPNNNEQVSIVIIGGTHDFSGTERPAAQIKVKDMRMGRFVP